MGGVLALLLKARSLGGKSHTSQVSDPRGRGSSLCGWQGTVPCHHQHHQLSLSSGASCLPRRSGRRLPGGCRSVTPPPHPGIPKRTCSGGFHLASCGGSPVDPRPGRFMGSGLGESESLEVGCGSHFPLVACSRMMPKTEEADLILPPPED